MERIKELSMTRERGGLKWQAVKKHIISGVSSGRYVPGDALPSENFLCVQTGLSRNTIRQAFDQLEKEGFVCRVRGKGTFLSNYKSDKKTQTTKMFGLLSTDIHRSWLPSLIRGFSDELFSNNSQMLICQTYNDVDRQGNVILQLLHRDIDGIAIFPVSIASTPPFQIELLLNNNIPVVSFHRPIHGVDIPVLCWDWEKVGIMAGEILLNAGHKRIAYYGVSRYVITESHIVGLRKVMASRGLELKDNCIFLEPFSDSDDEIEIKNNYFMKLLKSDNPPTAVMCNDDNEAERIYWLATKAGLSVPWDLSIIGFGNTYRGSVFFNDLTSIVVDEHEIGRLAAQILYEKSSGARPVKSGGVYKMELKVNAGSTVAAPKPEIN